MNKNEIIFNIPESNGLMFDISDKRNRQFAGNRNLWPSSNAVVGTGIK